MPFIPVANTAKVSIVGQLLGQQVVNTLHFTKSGAQDAASLAALKAAINTWVTTQWLPQMSTSLLIDRIDVVDLQSATGLSTQQVYTPAAVGSVPGATLPNNVSWVATHRTASRGRNYRGRSYLPGIPTSYTTGVNAATTSAIGNWLTALAWLMNTANTAAQIWVVVSRFLGNAPRANGIFTPVTAVTGDITLDSMRRRLPGRGA